MKEEGADCKEEKVLYNFGRRGCVPGRGRGAGGGLQGGLGGEAGAPPELRWLSLMLGCKMFEESTKSSN